MFEGNTISLKENNVTLLSNKPSYPVWQVAPFLRKVLVLSFGNASHSFEGKALLTKKRTLSQLSFMFESSTTFFKRI